MGSLFGGAKPAPVAAPAPLPQRDDTSVADAARREKQSASRRRGRRSTILTSGAGVSGEANIDRPGKTTLG